MDPGDVRRSDMGSLGLLGLVIVAVSALVVWQRVASDAADRGRLRDVLEQAQRFDERLGAKGREPLWWPAEPGDAAAEYRAAIAAVASFGTDLDNALGLAREEETTADVFARVAVGRGAADRDRRRRALERPEVAEAILHLERATHLHDVAGLRTYAAELAIGMSELADTLPAVFVARFVRRVESGDDQVEAIEELLPLFQFAVDVVESPHLHDVAARPALPTAALEGWFAEGRAAELDAAARTRLLEVLADLDRVLSEPLGDDAEVEARGMANAWLEATRSKGDEAPLFPWELAEHVRAAETLQFMAGVVDELRRVRRTSGTSYADAFERMLAIEGGLEASEGHAFDVGKLSALGAARLRAALLHDLRALRVAIARADGDEAFTLDDPYGGAWIVTEGANGVLVWSDSRWNDQGRAVVVPR
ncbi:MAG: hypothetical protein R3F34_06790 [Planctomycetota bacterium]